MRVKTIIFLTLAVCISKVNDVNGQSNISYVDSIKRYTKFVDSLVSSFYSNPQTRLGHSITHFTCISRKGGASIDLYEGSEGKVYQLMYYTNCDTPGVEKTYYFLNRKIVCASVVESPFGVMKRRTKFYQNDRLILSDSSWIKKRKQRFDKDLKEGYELLERSKT